MAFLSLGLHLGLDMGVARDSLLLLVVSWMTVVRVGKRLRLTRKTRPGAFSHVIPDPGHINAEEMEKIAPPLPPKEWRVRWGSLAIFFLYLSVQPEGASTLVLVHFF